MGALSPGAARALLALSIVASAIFALQSPALVVDDSPLYLGPARYWSQGQGLIEGPGRPLEYRLPAYPLLLGVAFRLFGESLRLITLVNWICHLGAVLLVRSMVAHRSPRAADAAAAATLVYPPFLTATAMVLQESFLSLTLALFAWTLTRAARAPRPGWSAAAGAALGVSALAKVTVLPMALPAAVLLVLRPSRSLVRLGFFAFGLACLLLPWAARNKAAFGRFEVTNNNGGHTFLGGTVTNEIDAWYGFPEYRAAVREWEEGGRRAEPVLDRYLYGVGLARIRADPARWLGLVAGRVVRFMLPARQWLAAVGLTRNGTLSLPYLVGVLWQVVLFGGAAGWALWIVSKRLPPENLVAPVLVFWHLAVYALVYASPRYNVTIGPLLFGCVAWLATRRMGRTTARGR